MPEKTDVEVEESPLVDTEVLSCGPTTLSDGTKGWKLERVSDGQTFFAKRKTTGTKIVGEIYMIPMNAEATRARLNSMKFLRMLEDKEELMQLRARADITGTEERLQGRENTAKALERDTAIERLKPLRKYYNSMRTKADRMALLAAVMSYVTEPWYGED